MFMGANELLGLLEDVTEESMGVKTAEQDSRPEVVWQHLGPEVVGIPDRDQILDTGNSLHGIRFGVFGRDLETHGLDQVVVECNE